MSLPEAITIFCMCFILAHYLFRNRFIIEIRCLEVLCYFGFYKLAHRRFENWLERFRKHLEREL